MSRNELFVFCVNACFFARRRPLPGWRAQVFARLVMPVFDDLVSHVLSTPPSVAVITVLTVFAFSFTSIWLVQHRAFVDMIPRRVMRLLSRRVGGRPGPWKPQSVRTFSNISRKYGRRMLSLPGREHLRQSARRLSVVQFNILASKLALPRHFPFANPESIGWAHRKHVLLRNIAELHADIMCLQELGTCQWVDAAAHVRGYLVVHAQTTTGSSLAPNSANLDTTLCTSNALLFIRALGVGSTKLMAAAFSSRSRTGKPLLWTQSTTQTCMIALAFLSYFDHDTTQRHAFWL